MTDNFLIEVLQSTWKRAKTSEKLSTLKKKILVALTVMNK